MSSVQSIYPVSNRGNFYSKQSVPYAKRENFNNHAVSFGHVRLFSLNVLWGKIASVKDKKSVKTVRKLWDNYAVDYKYNFAGKLIEKELKDMRHYAGGRLLQQVEISPETGNKVKQKYFKCDVLTKLKEHDSKTGKLVKSYGYTPGSGRLDHVCDFDLKTGNISQHSYYDWDGYLSFITRYSAKTGNPTKVTRYKSNGNSLDISIYDPSQTYKVKKVIHPASRVFEYYNEGYKALKYEYRIHPRKNVNYTRTEYYKADNKWTSEMSIKSYLECLRDRFGNLITKKTHFRTDGTRWFDEVRPFKAEKPTSRTFYLEDGKTPYKVQTF